MKASQASRCACSELNSCSSPSSDDFPLSVAQRTLRFCRTAVLGLFIGLPRRLECTRSLAETKEPWPRPMCPGDPLGNHSERPIPLAIVFEPFLAHEDGMGLSAPLPHQGRAALQRSTGMERTSAFLELYRQSPKAPLQGGGRAAMGPLLQLVDDTPDDQIATQPQRRAGVMQCPPSMPQLLRRPIDQPGNLAINRRAVRISRPVLPAPVCTETRGRLARVLASRCNVDWKFHKLAGSGMRETRARSSLIQGRGRPR